MTDKPKHATECMQILAATQPDTIEEARAQTWLAWMYASDLDDALCEMAVELNYAEWAIESEVCSPIPESPAKTVRAWR